MVDSTKGVGPPPHIQSANKASAARDEKRAEEAREEFKPAIDKVHISPEALDLTKAEKATAEVRAKLERDADATLGLDPNFDEDA